MNLRNWVKFAKSGNAFYNHSSDLFDFLPLFDLKASKVSQSKRFLLISPDLPHLIKVERLSGIACISQRVCACFVFLAELSGTF